MATMKRTLNTGQRIARRLSTALLIWFALVSPLYAANLAVLYPDAPPPYKQVFDQLIDGIEQHHDDRLVRYPLEKTFDPRSVIRQLERDQVDMVVTLGRRGYSLLPELEGRFPHVIGALPLTPNGEKSGVSLINDPDNLFLQLGRLAPQIKRVSVVYTDRSRWLIQLARASAKQRGLTLTEYKVDTLAEAVRQYEDVLDQVDPQTDAIWLPLDKITANEKVILPMLLREAWEKRIVVFSSKPSHVKRGTLFSIYPNNQQSGERLAEMVKDLFTNRSVPGIEPSRSMHLGVNLRTAVHLGLEYAPAMKRSFYRTYPQP